MINGRWRANLDKGERFLKTNWYATLATKSDSLKQNQKSATFYKLLAEYRGWLHLSVTVDLTLLLAVVEDCTHGQTHQQRGTQSCQIAGVLVIKNELHYLFLPF
jgi:hypothetical protein